MTKSRKIEKNIPEGEREKTETLSMTYYVVDIS